PFELSKLLASYASYLCRVVRQERGTHPRRCAASSRRNTVPWRGDPLAGQSDSVLVGVAHGQRDEEAAEMELPLARLTEDDEDENRVDEPGRRVPMTRGGKALAR